MEKITIKNPGDEESKGVDGRVEKTIVVESLSDVSDGYHTFDELYDHRITLFIALVKQILNQPYDDDAKFGIWRSKNHHDGTSWDGWFIMGIGKEKGKQISYHLPMSRWDETDFAETLPTAPEWDGHTSNDVLERLKAL